MNKLINTFITLIFLRKNVLYKSNLFVKKLENKFFYIEIFYLKTSIFNIKFNCNNDRYSYGKFVFNSNSNVSNIRLLIKNWIFYTLKKVFD